MKCIFFLQTLNPDRVDKNNKVDLILSYFIFGYNNFKFDLQ